MYIKYSKVEIHRQDTSEDSGWFTIIENPGWINLTDVLEASKILGGASLQAGRYNLIRFDILDQDNSEQYESNSGVPSEKLRIPITQGGITINAGKTLKMLIDFETRVTYP